MLVKCLETLVTIGLIDPASGVPERHYNAPGALVEIAEEDCPRLFKLGAVALPDNAADAGIGGQL